MAAGMKADLAITSTMEFIEPVRLQSRADDAISSGQFTG